MLRIPAQAGAGEVAEQLGLAVPEFQDVELAPVVFRKAEARTAARKAAVWELLVSATAVDALVGSSGATGYSSGSVLFADAFGVLVDGVMLAVESATESELGGTAYVYRLVLRASVSAVV